MDKVIEFNSISKFIKKRKIINNLSFDVDQGDICGFIGPNGAGKTTVMRLATGLIKPSSGEVLINNINIKDDRKRALQSLGAIVESPIFFPYMSGEKVLLNLAILNENMNKKEQKKKVEEVLKIVNLYDRRKDKVSTYSLGMKQRLGIAQALLNNPKIILLDEPANGLDPVGMVELRELILELNKKYNITFFISSHLLDELQKICTKLVIIKEGSLLWNGYKDDLISKFKGKKTLEEIFVLLMTSKELGCDYID